MRPPRLPKLPKSIEEAAEWYMHYVSPLALVAAFVIDTFFLLRRVDTLLTTFVLFFYLATAAAILVLISLIQTGRLRHAWLLTITPMLPVVSQYAFGGLFIAFLSLYSRSAAFSLSWIFVAIIATLLIANERFVRFYMRFSFQVTILYTVLFSFLIFYVPLMVGGIGPHLFVLSGVASILIIAAFLYAMFYLVPTLVQDGRAAIARSIAVIFVIFNVLYFTNAIPPLPLALKEAGVYHRVTREGNAYKLLAEPNEWYEPFLRYNTEYHREPGESVSVYTAIFAPAGLTTSVVHEWQYFNEARDAWETRQRVPFSIVGGREEGYRGYTLKASPEVGPWRVNVTTEYGQVIGRVAFTVVPVDEPPPVEEVIR